MNDKALEELRIALDFLAQALGRERTLQAFPHLIDAYLHGPIDSTAYQSTKTGFVTKR